MNKTAWLVSVLGLLLTACQTGSSTRIPAYMPTFVSPTAEYPQMTPSLIVSVDNDLQALIEKTRQDLAQKLGISVESIKVVSVIGQEFSTDAFQCRTSKERTAKEEAPLVISGHSVLLRVSGRRYEYHISDQTVVFCRPLN